MNTGLATTLGYTIKAPNAPQRAMQRFGSTRPGAWALSKTFFVADKALFRVTGGRHTLPSLLAALPVLMLTTTGARTGQERTTPLIGIPLDDDLAVLGTNYGQPATPSWVYNLEANPSAVVRYRDVTIPVTTRRADPSETDQAFHVASGLYPGYPRYRVRAGHRDIRVFVLEAAE